MKKSVEYLKVKNSNHDPTGKTRQRAQSFDKRNPSIRSGQPGRDFKPSGSTKTGH